MPDATLRPDYNPGFHDPWTGKDLAPEDRRVPQQYAPLPKPAEPAHAPCSAAKRSA